MFIATGARKNLPNDSGVEAMNFSTVYCDALNLEVDVPPLNNSFCKFPKLFRWFYLKPFRNVDAHILAIYDIAQNDPVLCSVEDDTTMTCNCSCSYSENPTSRKTSGLAIISIGNVDDTTEDINRYFLKVFKKFGTLSRFVFVHVEHPRPVVESKLPPCFDFDFLIYPSIASCCCSAWMTELRYWAHAICLIFNSIVLCTLLFRSYMKVHNFLF